jgi:hypothetical protein
VEDLLDEIALSPGFQDQVILESLAVIFKRSCGCGDLGHLGGSPGVLFHTIAGPVMV